MKNSMKMPVARQLPSGSWFCRVRVDGKDLSITRDTKKQAIAEAVAIKYGIKDAAKKRKTEKTITQAIDDYIESRENVLSPSTIRGYRAIQKGRFAQLMCKNVFEITPEQCQRAVNAEAKLVSAKTLTNAWRFLSSVIFEETGERITVRLPQIVANERPFLTAEQIPIFVSAIHDTSVEIPALLALSSLRRSEIINLRWMDVDTSNGVIHVNGAAVYDEHGNLIRKQTTKNKTSRRMLPIIEPLKNALMRTMPVGEYVVEMHPTAIMKHINRICVRNNLPEVGLHGLRHSFASLAYHLNIPEKITMEIGGWANDQTMRKIYTHLAQKDIADRAKDLRNFFTTAKNGNKIDNDV